MPAEYFLKSFSGRTLAKLNCVGGHQFMTFTWRAGGEGLKKKLKLWTDADT